MNAINAAIEKYRPGAKFAMQGSKVDPHTADNGDACFGLVWEGPGARPTQAEVDAWAAEVVADGTVELAEAKLSSRSRDRLAQIAWALRFKNPQAWSALTDQQKRDAILAEADAWATLRAFVGRSL